MRSILWCSILSAALLGGTACKKHDESTSKAGTELKKAQEEVNDKEKDVRKAEAKVTDKEGSLDNAKMDLEKARTDFTIAAKARLMKLDAKLDMLAARTDAAATEAADNLRARRAVLESKINDVNSQVQTNWDDFKKEVDGMFDAMDHDADAAMKKSQ